MALFSFAQRTPLFCRKTWGTLYSSKHNNTRQTFVRENCYYSALKSLPLSVFPRFFFLLTPFFIFSSRFLIKTRLYIVFPIYTRTQMNLLRFSSRSFIFLFFFLYSLLFFLYSYLKMEIIVA